MYELKRQSALLTLPENVYLRAQRAGILDRSIENHSKEILLFSNYKHLLRLKVYEFSQMSCKCNYFINSPPGQDDF